MSGALVLIAYLTVLLIGLGLYGSMCWGLALLQRKLSAPTHTERVRAGGPSAGDAQRRPTPATR